MMRIFIVFWVITLMACSSPSLKFSGIPPVQVTVEDSIFDVYSNGQEVQAIRVNFQVLPSMSTTIARAISAIESATGCKVVPSSISGDQALVKAKITCKDT